MNMNATAQMVTTSQVGCGRKNWEEIARHEEKEANDLSDLIMRLREAANVKPLNAAKFAEIEQQWRLDTSS